MSCVCCLPVEHEETLSSWYRGSFHRVVDWQTSIIGYVRLAEDYEWACNRIEKSTAGFTMPIRGGNSKAREVVRCFTRSRDVRGHLLVGKVPTRTQR